MTSERFRREAAGSLVTCLVLRVDVARATAWTWAANGEVSRAREALLTIAERCRTVKEPAIEVHVLHDAVRLGARWEVVDRLRDLATVVDGAWAPVFADHARALVDGNGAALDDVASRRRRSARCATPPRPAPRPPLPITGAASSPRAMSASMAAPSS